MLLLSFFLLAQLSGLLAAPTSSGAYSGLIKIKRSNSINLGLDYTIADPSFVRRLDARGHQIRAAATAPAASVAAANSTATNSTAVSSAATNSSAAGTCAAPVTVAAAATEGEGAVEQEREINATFGQTVALDGGNVKTDVFYPPSTIGFLEVEFQNADARTLIVTENKSPASPPAGFVALEPSSFLINLAGGSEGLTLTKVDYFFDVTNAAVAALDLTQSQIGKLSTTGCSFVIDPAFGTLEFEAEENELTLTVADLNGEWGIFIPQAGGAAVNAAAAAATATVATTAVVAAATATAAAAGEASGDEVLVNGTFGVATAVTGGNVKTDILFTANAAGAFEVEHNGTAANAIAVVRNASPADPPAGFLFVDPTTFQVSTAAATDPATDTVKIDYFYSERVKGLVDVTQGVIGKLDAATNTFVTSGLGEFEIELEENEWTLTVADLNGEWAILIPQAAVL